MRFLLDTNVFIAAMKGIPAVRDELARLAASDLIVSPIVLGELETGVRKSAFPESNARRLSRLLEFLELVPVDAAAARHYADIRARLESTGRSIGANDLWIAAQARALGATVVTDNLSEFQRVESLCVLNWLR